MGTENSDLGTYLRGLRSASGLTLRGVEQRIRVSNALLSQLESGKVKQPSPVILYKLAEVYGAPYETLMEKAGYPVMEPRKSPSRDSGDTRTKFGRLTVEEEEALLSYLAFLRSRSARGRSKR